MRIARFFDNGNPFEEVNLQDKGRIFELECVLVEHPRRYPKYHVEHYSIAFCQSKESAEKILKEKLQSDEEWLQDLYCFYIYERVLDVRYDRVEYMACWLYDVKGMEIDKRSFPSYWSEDGFVGRSEDEVRFKFGDLAELCDGERVLLVWVLAPPQNKDWYTRKTIEEGKSYCGDISDDSYIVIDGPGYQWHMHVDALTLFRPHFPIPKNIMRKYEKMWKGYLDDRRECYGPNPTIHQI